MRRILTTWLLLLAVAAAAQEPEVGFEDLVQLTDREIQTLMRETDQKDLVVALKAAGEELKDKILGNLSERVRSFITEEMEFLGPIPLDEIEVVQRRIVGQARILGAQGRIGWPPGTGLAGRAARSVGRDPLAWMLAGRLRTTLNQPFAGLGFAEIVAVMSDLGYMARRAGILSLEPVILDLKTISEPEDELFRSGVTLALDGAEPELIQDLLQTRTQTLLYQRQKRYEMIIKGLLSVQVGDNPCITEHALMNHYAVAEEVGISYCHKNGRMTVLELKAFLKEQLQRPYPQLSFDELTDVMSGLANLARRQGIRALAGIADAARREPFLQSGLYLAIDGTHPEILSALMEERKSALMEEQEIRFRMITEGVAGIQPGDNPDFMAAQLGALYSR